MSDFLGCDVKGLSVADFGQLLTGPVDDDALHQAQNRPFYKRPSFPLDQAAHVVPVEVVQLLPTQVVQPKRDGMVSGRRRALRPKTVFVTDATDAMGSLLAVSW